ncbi:Chitin-binding type 1 [Arabidopsis thaliana x Arabidopsis arenosa]|uniref:Chitin-binding type 1 n=1 Tax=Arabidopsis thaliana x Arabidopsis arenosa TaxID=1240361 RepID=A0A8T2AC36_9BRAS|nr:Chitin-binding type 1 [Arabidopsis thaliana x Arabidopsis arenosa]
MTSQNAILKNALVYFLFILAFLAETVFSQNCMDTSCPGLKECCSRWGFCGTKEDYCGFFCFSGPCNIKGKSYGYDYNVDAGPRGKIETVITPALFDSIMSKVESNCSAKGFYTYEAFITAFKSFGAYKGKVAKREIAAILAHFSYGSKSFCYKEEISNERYCSKSKKYPCEPGKNYYGRGLLQSITWNEYYGAAGKHLRLPLLKDPDLVARSPEVAFKFAMWFWNRNVRPALYLGFGEITKRVDGRECGNWRRDDTKNKVKQYIEFCEMLGVTPDQGLDC